MAEENVDHASSYDLKARERLLRERMAEENVDHASSYDLKALISTKTRDFLVRKNGDQVKIDELRGKIVGIYFSASWCGPCRRFTPQLIEAYMELSSKNDFEVIFISGDNDEKSFNEYFETMPWLAIPHSDSETISHLNSLFHVNGIPSLVLLDPNGKVLTDNAVSIIGDYGIEAYPFSPERLEYLKEEEERAKRDQTLRSILVTKSRDFVVSNDGKKVPVSELEGKIVGLYFLASFAPAFEFNKLLEEIYGKLREKGESFEVVLISLDEEEEAYKKSIEHMPWLALPLKDSSCHKLISYFELSTLPTLVIIGSDGKTLHPNVAELVEEFGILAYPFTPEKLVEIEEIKKAKLEAQTLESILVSGDRDFVIAKDGIKVPVSELVGKNILLYFSAHWCPPCRAFLPKLIEAYHDIKAKDDAFEVIFISSDRDQSSFEDFFSNMPWLALPFGDERKKSLSSTFKVRGIPTVIAIGPTGRTVSQDARGLLMLHGANAYPFTEERVKQIEAELEEKVKGWPEKLKHELHEDHELLLRLRRAYRCDGCDEMGNGFAYNCAECDFDLHPNCAFAEGDESGKKDMEKENNENSETDVNEESGKDEIMEAPEGWVCDGDACQRA